MKLSFTTILCSILTIVVAGTVMLSSCNDTPTTTATKPAPHIAGTEQRPTLTPTAIPLPSMSRFETGMVTPAWSHDAYSNYTSTLRDMKAATNARWVELPILLQQATSTSTHVDVSPNQVTPQSLEDGIRAAHTEGLRGFVVPLMSVHVQGDWAGTIVPTDTAAWFASYWHAFQPYVNVAVRAGADQLAIGTEMNWLQNNADATLWEHLITEVTNAYHGRLTYDSNWSEIYKPVPSWMHDSRLSYIGVSTYIDLVASAEYVDPVALPAMWRSVIQSQLDAFSLAIDKPILISEIGYRDTSDALYHTWSTTSSASTSQIEQAGAYDAALSDIQGDGHIVGFFPWGWSNVGNMTVKGMQAAGMIKKHYQNL
jgi:hypothetical protein